VVAVVVTHDAGPWLEDTLRSLAAQTYPNLTVLVIDAASTEDQHDRVKAVLPGAHVHRLARNPGFGGAANQLIGAVRGASYYLLCHDDVALERDAVRALVARAERFGAGVVGPKLVSWDDPGVLLALGLGADRTGVALPLVERGELDQAQHDGLAEVFAVPSACLLIRSELFERLGGFDPAMGDVGEDLDLCWRAQVAGARVAVAPGAKVRHRESRADGPAGPARQRLQARHRLRTVLSCYRPLQLARVLPRLLVLAVVEAVAGMVGGPSHAGKGVLAGWWWNLCRLPQIHRRRRQLGSIRTVSDAEVRHRQTETGALAALLRQELDPTVEARVEPRAGTAWPTATTVGAVAVVAMAVLGARHLLTAGVPAVGELAPFPDRPWTLLEQWTTGWRQAGFGSDASPPTALGLLGMLGLASGGAVDLLRTVLVLGLVPVGVLGACRLAAPLRSRRATLVALVAYLAVPVPYNAIAAGSWSGLAAYAVAPWLLFALARASRLEPYPAASWPRQVLGLGLVLAVVGAFVPVVAVMAVAMAVAMAAASLLCGRLRGSLRMVGLAAVAGLLGVVLHGPWLADLPRRLADWQQVAGLDVPGGTWSALELSRFWSGPYGSSPLIWGLVAAAAVALLVARDAALEWAVRGWFVALAGWAVLYAAGQGWIDVGLPAAEVVLAPVAAGLSLAAAAGSTAVDRAVDQAVDRAVGGGRARRALAGLGTIALLVGAMPLAAGLVDGRWGLPSGDFGPTLATTVAADQAPSRLLWIGRPDAVPVAGRAFGDDLVLGTSGVGPQIGDRWPAPDDPVLTAAGDALEEAQRGGTTRLGRLLGPMGVRYLVVPTRTAPQAAGGERRSPPRSLTDALAAQLDLEPLEADPALVVYENRAWLPEAARLPDAVEPGDRPTDAVDDPLRAPPPEDVLRADGPAHYRGGLRPGTVLFATGDGSRWRLEVDGEQARPEPAYGVVRAYEVEATGPADLRYRTPAGRWPVLVGQGALWVAVALAWWLLGRRRTRRRPEDRQ
jgi:GT2 family glycosyltransferase